MWLPGSEPPAHLDGSLPGDFGWDPLGLGANKERLTWFAEAERVHARWAMLGVAGIMVQEVLKPDIFWYDAPTKIDLPFNVVGLVLFELVTMHWVESKVHCCAIHSWHTLVPVITAYLQTAYLAWPN